ncbi:MAG: hypothetical protein ABH856_02540 [Patescibacteria group bacterium]|nr:hypothetical protein [Patescibacteria group bacterium]
MVIQDFLFRKHLNDGETILSVAHKHLWVVLPTIFKDLFFGVGIPMFLFMLFPQIAFYMLIWVWGGLLVLSYHLYDWYFDAWLMTNQGVLDVEWKSFFNRTSARIEYHMVEGVSYEVTGFWQTVLNFGVVTLEKVGSGVLVQLVNVNNPKRVERELLGCQKKYLTQKAFREHGALKDLLTDMVMGHIKDNDLIEDLQKKINE